MQIHKYVKLQSEVVIFFCVDEIRIPVQIQSEKINIIQYNLES